MKVLITLVVIFFGYSNVVFERSGVRRFHTIDSLNAIEFFMKYLLNRVFIFYALFSCGDISIEESIHEVIHPSMKVHRLVSPFKNGGLGVDF